MVKPMAHKMNETYGFFHPENNRRAVAELSFDTVQEAIVLLKNERWSQIEKCSSKDEAAFMSLFGEIIVIRAIED